MGGLLHLFDFNQGSSSRKSQTHKKNVDGLEAPRNSMELPIETLQSYDTVGENIPYSYKVKQNSSKRNRSSNGAPMKKLIDEEISKEPDVRHNVPSVVARLMGMDMLPSDTKPTIHTKGIQNEIREKSFSRTEPARNGSAPLSPLGLKNSKQTEHDVPSHWKEEHSDQLSNSLKFEKPRPREHPQEEELQKFKKEFEAWQAAKAWEHPKVVEHGSIPRQWLAQEHLQKEKKTCHSVSKNVIPSDKSTNFNAHAPRLTLKASTLENSGLQYDEHKKESSEEHHMESVTLRGKSRTSDVEQVPMPSCDEKDKSFIPTKIVILKPGPDRFTGGEHSWAGSSQIVEEGGTMEDFLEEVKERLRFEMQGKSIKRDLVVRGSGIETPFSEKPSSPRQISRNFAKQARESVNTNRDSGINLVRSESTRSYRSEVQVNGPGSPEFLNSDTRKLLSQRLRNVMKEETNIDAPNFIGGSLRASTVGDKERRLGTLDVLKRDNYGGSLDELEWHSSSFRYGQQKEMLQMGEMSPRNLVRSMSAPVSGTSFGKLLLEDRHVVTGAQIRRRHESTENVSVEVRKPRKEKFNFRGKVSNLKDRFTLKGKLFGRKIQSVEESWSNESDYMKDMMSGPTVVRNLGFARSQENSTEVPPSPASVCSSIQEDFYRTAGHPSPISTLDVPMIEDHAVPQVFRDISSNLNELRRQLDQLEFGASEDIKKVEEPLVAEMVELEGQAEAYIKDLLIVSGLYDGFPDQSSSRWDSYSKPVNNWVFHKVEESYKKRPEEDEATKDPSELRVDHKVLFDLLNEALPIILGTSVTMSTFKRKIVGPTMKRTPHQKDLLDRVWRMIRMYVHPPCDGLFYSLDGMVARDLRINPWLDMIQDDVYMIGREMENLILGELIEETLRDIWS